MENGLPQLLFKTEPRFRWWGPLTVLLTSHTPKVGAAKARFFRNAEIAQSFWPFRTIFSSIVLHVAFVILLVRFPLPTASPSPEWDETDHWAVQMMYYDLRAFQPARSLPNVTPPGPGGRPDQGSNRLNLPRLGSSIFHPKMTIVANFPHPRRRQQTLVHLSLPDLKVPMDIPVPNLVIVNPVAPPKPKYDLALEALAPTLQNQKKIDSVEAPELRATVADVPIAQQPITLSRPHLQIPVQTQFPRPNSATRSVAGIGGQGPAGDDASDADSMLAIGTAPANTQFSLPGGNMYGSLAIAPIAGPPGSPGGAPNGDPRGGEGGTGPGPGPGGDESSGLGKGNRGGGGGGSETAAHVSIAGGNSGRTSTSSGLLADYMVPESLVYHVQALPVLRRPALIVSAGPIGGGGLAVYGVLRGRRILTIYLQMEGGNWTLEYCELEDPPSQATPAPAASQSQIRILPPLVPPSPLERFDFQRPPVPADTRHPLIVLHGTIKKDGTVDDLSFLDGPDPNSEQAALAAFKKWKFMPALKGGRPAAVEVLVGIPAVKLAP